MRQEDVVLVGIVDNGKGFDLRAVESNYDKRGSLGMVNLKERTELVGGTLRIESQIGKGTSITVLVPIKDELLRPSDRRSRRANATGSTSKLAAHAVERLRTAQQNTDIYQ
jgi:signal transduction histidine kinase